MLTVAASLYGIKLGVFIPIWDLAGKGISVWGGMPVTTNLFRQRVWTNQSCSLHAPEQPCTSFHTHRWLHTRTSEPSGSVHGPDWRNTNTEFRFPNEPRD